MSEDYIWHLQYGDHFSQNVSQMVSLVLSHILAHIVTAPYFHCPIFALPHIFTVPYLHCPIFSLPHVFTAPCFHCPMFSLPHNFTAPYFHCHIFSLPHSFTAPYFSHYIYIMYGNVSIIFKIPIDLANFENVYGQWAIFWWIYFKFYQKFRPRKCLLLHSRSPISQKFVRLPPEIASAAPRRKK